MRNFICVPWRPVRTDSGSGRAGQMPPGPLLPTEKLSVPLPFQCASYFFDLIERDGFPSSQSLLC
jgi:hypothetical protein